MPLPPLQILTIEGQHDLVARYLEGQLHGEPIQILEAGCGRQWYFSLPRGRYKLTGVDLDRDALAARQSNEDDLDEVIVGDLQHVEIPHNFYDVIYSAYVLEHIEGAEAVLDRFRSWLKPNGLLVLYIPDRQSAYGYFSMITPHWLHVWFYRYILGRKTAGQPGFAPYPTHYDAVVSREGVHRYAHAHGLQVMEECGYYKPPGLASLFMSVIHILSLRRLASSHCDLLFVLKAPATSVRSDAGALVQMAP